jgi:hypothetical protein
MVFSFPETSTFERRLQMPLTDRESGWECLAMVCQALVVEKGGRRTGADRSPKTMNELSHASACVAICGGDVVLREAIDEDPSQRLVLAVVRRRIGIQEKSTAIFVIHDWPLKC